MYLPLWKNSNLNQYIISCVLVVCFVQYLCANVCCFFITSDCEPSQLEQMGGFQFQSSCSDCGESAHPVHQGEMSKKSLHFAFDKSCPKSRELISLSLLDVSRTNSLRLDLVNDSKKTKQKSQKYTSLIPQMF